MLRSFIVRVYSVGGKHVPGAALRGVVENPGREQRSFRSIDELARILESDEPRGKTHERQRK